MYFMLDHYFRKLKFSYKLEILEYLNIKESNMPGVIERPKMTKAVYQSLKKYIMREHEKKKQEQEQDKEKQRIIQERENRKKKEEEDSLTLEQTKEQIINLKKKRMQLNQQKDDLYNQLKQVMTQEDESKRKIRDQNESINMQSYTSGLSANGQHPVFMQGGMLRQSTKYMNAIPQNMIPSLKRRRSPSPTHGNAIYPYSVNNVKYGIELNKDSFHSHKPPGSFPGQGTHVTYVTQTGQPYQPPQSQKQVNTCYSSNQSVAANCKFVASQSAFSSYPNHFPHQQKQISNHFPPPQGYQLQGVPQPQSGYMNSSLAVAAAAASNISSQNIPLQQQLEHANKKSGFSDEKFKHQQQQQQQNQQHVNQIRNLSQTQRNQLVPHPHPSSSPTIPQPKGSIVTGYPVRTQPSSPYPQQSVQQTQRNQMVAHPHPSSSPTMPQQKGSNVTGYPVRTQPSSPYPQQSVQVSHSNSPVAARHAYNNSQQGGRPYY